MEEENNRDISKEEYDYITKNQPKEYDTRSQDEILKDIFKQWEKFKGVEQAGTINPKDIPKAEDFMEFFRNLEKAIHSPCSSKIPDNTTLLLDKITGSLANGLIPYGAKTSLKMEGKGRKKQVTTFVTLDMEEFESILPSNIGVNDIMLLEAITSLYLANKKEGINTFTLNDIYKVEKRNLNTRPNKKSLEQLEKRIEKLKNTLITIDVSQEMLAGYITDIDLKIKEKNTPLLFARLFEAEFRGNTVIFIQILDEPILYRYSKSRQQVTNIPFCLTDNELIKTESVLKLERYLTQRIVHMRNKKNAKISKSILFNTIYEEMNYTQTTEQGIKNAMTTTRKNTEEILKQFITTKYIKDYEIVSKGKTTYYKIVIKLQN